MFECFKVFAFLYVLSPDVADQSANPVDIIGQAHNTNDLYEDQT